MPSTILFVLSKLVWALIDPSSLLILLLTAGILLLWTDFAGLGRRLATAAAIGLVAIAVLPVGDGLMMPLENRFPAMRTLPAHVDGIIVIGGAIELGLSQARKVPSLNDAAERMTTFAALARHYPGARLVFSGGSGLLERIPLREADVARDLFGSIGVDTGRMTFESNSRNTVENAVFSKALVHPKPGETWILVTSAYHMPRAVGVFRHAGWQVLAYPTAYKTRGTLRIPRGLDLPKQLLKVDQAMHEWVGLVYYRLTGRIDTLFPSP